MISRVAEHCFWMSRYLERAENTARVLEVNLTLLLDLDVPLEQQWKPLLIISGIHDFTKEPDAEAVQHYLTWDAGNLCSVAASLEAARENGRIIREVISLEVWERLNYYYLWLQGPIARELYDLNRSEFYNQIRRINQLIHGISEGTMAHDEAWEFFQLGRYLERACQTARILDVKYHILLPTPEHVGTPVDSAQWAAILTSCSGYEPFHKQWRSGDTGVGVAEFLILDPLFPRSVLWCLRQCLAAAQSISGRSAAETVKPVDQGLEDLLGWLEASAIEDLVKMGLHEALTRVVNSIHTIGEVIRHTYFDVGPQKPGAATRSAPKKATRKGSRSRQPAGS
jgi:uncharacterized alpha-E superfamily protein